MHFLSCLHIHESFFIIFPIAGSSVGAGLTYILCGFLMDAWGWEAVFYFTGSVGTIWYLAWLFLVFDSPAQHPRISQAERKFIEDSLGKTVNKKSVSNIVRTSKEKTKKVFMI